MRHGTEAQQRKSSQRKSSRHGTKVQHVRAIRGCNPCRALVGRQTPDGAGLASGRPRLSARPALTTRTLRGSGDGRRNKARGPSPAPLRVSDSLAPPRPHGAKAGRRRPTPPLSASHAPLPGNHLNAHRLARTTAACGGPGGGGQQPRHATLQLGPPGAWYDSPPPLLLLLLLPSCFLASLPPLLLLLLLISYCFILFLLMGWSCHARPACLGFRAGPQRQALSRVASSSGPSGRRRPTFRCVPR